MAGAWGGTFLTHLCAPAGVFIVVVCGLLSGWMLSPLWHLTNPGMKLAAAPVSLAAMASSMFRQPPRQRSSIIVEDSSALPEKEPDFVLDDQDEDDVYEEEEFSAEEPPDGLKINPPVALALHAQGAQQTQREYQLPDFDLLDPPEEFDYELLARKARLAAATLEKTFQQFGLNIKISGRHGTCDHAI